jgi:acetate kinase
MKILTVNTGSSSVKCKLYAGDGLDCLVSGRVERIGDPEAMLMVETSGRQLRRSQPAANHAAAVEQLFALFAEAGVIAGAQDLAAVGHRVVHGGERFRSPVRVTDAVLGEIRRLVPLAPLHNPLALTGIEVFARLAPALPQVAVFDTAFHQEMPPHAYLYALPYHLYQEHGIRRYGFHGISHAYVAREAARFLGRPAESLNLVTLHLGQGASAAAIRGGRCVDTSMGMTPLEGLMMGTRCGDIDPALPLYLQREVGLAPAEVERLLNHDSGLQGVGGEDDMRAIHARCEEGDQRACLAVEMFVHRVRKYLGAYAAVLGRLDAVAFTGGIGENDPVVRAAVCSNLGVLGITLDNLANASGGGRRAIHAPNSAVEVLVIPTDEEREIARATAACIAP